MATEKPNQQIPSPKPHSPWFGVLLSFLIPGAGHVAAGQRVLGIRWFVGLSAASFVVLWLLASSRVPGLIFGLIAGAGAFVAWIVMLCSSYRPVPRLSRAKYWTVILLVALLSLVLGEAERRLALLYCQAFKMPTNAMAPAIEGKSGPNGAPGSEGDCILVEKYAYWFSKPKAGDIVVFDTSVIAGAWPKGQVWAKRVVGVPGDKVEMVGRTLLVNGQPRKETYTQFIDPGSIYEHYGPFNLAQAEYFVMGDNRDHSQDSRWLGPIPESSIVGKVSKIYWPPHRMGEVR
jgi:signal peptidase I